MLESEERALAFKRSRVVSLNIRSALLEPSWPRRSPSSETERLVEIRLEVRPNMIPSMPLGLGCVNPTVRQEFMQTRAHRIAQLCP